MKHINHKNSPYSFIYGHLARLLNVPMNITNKTIGEAFTQAKLTKSHKWIKENEPWFLDLKFNSKMPDKAVKRDGKF